MSFRPYLILLAVLGLVPASSSAEEPPRNYQILIDGKVHEIDIGQVLQVAGPDGGSFTLELRKKAFAQYADAYVRYQYPGDLAVARTDLNDGITQLVTSTADGVAIIVQEHPGEDVEPLVPIILDALTRESVGYGFEMRQETLRRRLASGLELEGMKATLTHEGDDEIEYYEVLSWGGNGKGVILVTLIDEDDIAASGHVLDHFWETLSLEF